MDYKNLIFDILNFDWDNKNDDFKHWNCLRFYSNDNKMISINQLNKHNDSFILSFSNYIVEFYLSTFGYLSYLIEIKNNKIIASKPDDNTKTFEFDTVEALLKFMNSELNTILKDSEINDDGYISNFLIPNKSIPQIHLHYSNDLNTFIVKSRDFNADIIDKIDEFLSDYLKGFWFEHSGKDSIKSSDFNYKEKRSFYLLIHDFLSKNNFIELVESFNHTEIKEFNVVFHF